MADFCTKCVIEVWGSDIPPDLNIKEIGESLKPETYLSVICEGCGMRAIGKETNGTIMIAMPINDMDESLETRVYWETLEEWEKKYETEYKRHIYEH
jgi:hypothetical protein